VRELLANALAHRPYTQRGDIFINLYPDRLEVHNPGLLPIGVTPQNILHASSARNRHLAKIFYDLKLMETEGSGFDRMYQALLSSGRPAPEVSEGHDRVTVTVQKQIARPGIVDFMSKANKTYQPTQKELITLGLVAQHGPVTAIELERLLELAGADDLKHWLGRLRTWRLVNARGRTKGTEYYVDPDVLRRLRFKGPTTLKGIERPRLRELILRDLMIHRHSSRAEIHARIGKEIPVSKLRRALIELVVEGVVATEGETKARQYYLIATGPKTTL
jgi:ATP-dependent DNA helicase RecG